MSDAVEHPKHYNAHQSGIEAIEICEVMGFCLGNAVKYLWRAGKKPGQVDLGSDGTVEDLKKSAWYLRRAVGKQHRLGIDPRDHFPLTKVLAAEAAGSVLRDVLELTVSKMLIGDQPRVADALVRVEREIASR